MKEMFSKFSYEFSKSTFSPFVRLITMFIFSLALSNLIVVNAIERFFSVEGTTVSLWVLVISFVFEFIIVVRIPFGKKRHTNIFIMLIPDKLQNDYPIIKNTIFKDIKRNFPEYKFYCPNVFARLLFNAMLENENSAISKIYICIFKKISKSSLCIYGNTVRGFKSSENSISIIDVSILSFTQGDKYFDTICKNLNASRLPVVENENIKYIQNTSGIILLYLKMALSVTGLLPENSLKVLEENIQLFENSKNSEYEEIYGDNFINQISDSIEATICWQIVNMSYTEENSSEFLSLCKRFLKLAPNNDDVIVTYQYCQVRAMLCDENLCHDTLKVTADELLKYCNITLKGENTYTLTANMAFLQLITDNFSEAIKLYNTIKSSPDVQKCQTNTVIYEFLERYSRETSNYLNSYVKFAFCIVRLNMQSRDATTDKKIKDDLLCLMEDNNSMIKAEAKKLYDVFF